MAVGRWPGKEGGSQKSESAEGVNEIRVLILPSVTEGGQKPKPGFIFARSVPFGGYGFKPRHLGSYSKTGHAI